MKEIIEKLGWREILASAVLVALQVGIGYAIIHESLSGRPLGVFEHSAVFRAAIVVVLIGAVLLVNGFFALIVGNSRLARALRHEGGIDGVTLGLVYKHMWQSVLMIAGVGSVIFGFVLLYKS